MVITINEEQVDIARQSSQVCFGDNIAEDIWKCRFTYGLSGNVNLFFVDCDHHNGAHFRCITILLDFLWKIFNLLLGFNAKKSNQRRPLPSCEFPVEYVSNGYNRTCPLPILGVSLRHVDKVPRGRLLEHTRPSNLSTARSFSHGKLINT